ncbi:MAG: tetratricopeptide repeat protein [Bacteroidota bacterium]
MISSATAGPAGRRLVARCAACLLAMGLWMVPAGAAQSIDGVALFESGELEEASAHFAERLEEDRGDAEAAYYLGRVAMEREQYAEAAEYFEQARRAKPQQARHHYWVGAALGLQAQSANVVQQARLARKTRAAFEQAVTLNPDYVEAREALIQFYLQAPGILGGSVGAARAQAEAISEIDPWRGHLATAVIHRHEGEHREAVAAYRAAIDLHPDWTYAYTLLLEYYEERGDREDALDLMEEARAAVPGEADFHYHYARLALLSQDALEPAAEAAESFIALADQPDAQADGYHLLGRIRLAEGDTEAARAAWTMALTLDPEHRAAQQALEKL